MLTTSIIAALSSLLLVNAQNPQIEVLSIEQQFHNAYLVPDLIATFNPIAYLTVNFGANSVAPGTLLAVAGQSPPFALTPIKRLGIAFQAPPSSPSVRKQCILKGVLIN